jgi:flagellar hook protein FlgE
MPIIIKRTHARRWTAMSNTANIALSALQAFSRKSDVIANNIANVQTDGFKKSRADMEEASPSGVDVTIRRVNTPEDMVTIGDVERETSNVNLEEELIAPIVNRNNYTANINTVKADNEMQGTLFDILG